METAELLIEIEEGAYELRIAGKNNESYEAKKVLARKLSAACEELRAVNSRKDSDLLIGKAIERANSRYDLGATE